MTRPGLPILFLDVATQTGWAEGGLSAERPQSGTLRLAPPGSPSPAVFGGMMAFLGTRLSSFRYAAVAYEAPLDPRTIGKQTNMKTARLLIGLCGVVEAICEQTGHRVAEVRVHDARHYVVGRRPPKGEGKTYAMSALRMQGFEFSDDNEADAIAGWLYSCHLFRRKLMGEKTLFS